VLKGPDGPRAFLQAKWIVFCMFGRVTEIEDGQFGQLVNVFDYLNAIMRCMDEEVLRLSVCNAFKAVRLSILPIEL
jgi:hypothetical protein